MKYIDLHSDTITVLKYPKEDLDNNHRMVNIMRMKEADTMLQCFSAFVPTGFYPGPWKNHLVWKKFCAIADKKEKLLKRHQESLAPVLHYEDIAYCTRNHKIGVIFTSEDLGVIGEDIHKLEIAYESGIRIASLTWNHENTIGFPNSSKPGVMQRGLKPFGRQVIDRMDELGILIDVSHLSDGGFWDVAKHSRKPFVATHSNSRAMTDHPRNLTDDMIKALADKGGVMGLNFSPRFLSSKKDDASRIEDMVRHVLHIRKVGGSGVLALGSDFDGIAGQLEISDPSKMPLLERALSKCGMSSGEIEKMFYKNALRVFRALMME